MVLALMSLSETVENNLEAFFQKRGDVSDTGVNEGAALSVQTTSLVEDTLSNTVPGFFALNK